MAIKTWRGGAAAVTQITTITYSAYTSGETYTLTINSKDVTFLATVSTIANVIAGLVAAIAASAEPEFAEFSAVSNSGLVLTGNTAGNPFVITSTATDSITATVTATQASTGPNFFNNADNWEGGSVPSAADDLVFSGSSVSLEHALVDATIYGNITIDSTYSGNIGLPADNVGGYREYRPRFLKLGDGSSAFSVIIGQGTGRQSNLIQIDGNNATVNAAIYNTGNSTTSDFPVVIKNTDNSSVCDVFGGSVKFDADTSGALSQLRVTPGQGANGVQVEASTTVACGTVTAAGGSLAIRGSATLLKASDGAQVTLSNAATCPTVNVSSGATVFWSSTAGITTKAFVFHQGTLDFSLSASTKAVQACDLFYGGIVRDPIGIVTYTTSIVLQGAKLSEVQLDVGRGRTIGIS